MVLKYLIPGGARPTGFMTPRIVTAVAAGLGALGFGMGTFLQDLATHAYGGYFGLSSIKPPQLPGRGFVGKCFDNVRQGKFAWKLE